MKTCWLCGADATCEYGTGDEQRFACSHHDPLSPANGGTTRAIPFGFHYRTLWKPSESVTAAHPSFFVSLATN